MEYVKCLVEVDEILKYLKNEDLIKIPVEIRNAISEKKDSKYSWSYDSTKLLSEQNLNRKSIAILSYLNMEYLLNKEQKELMMNIHKQNEQLVEKEKSIKYNPNNIFNKKENNGIEEQKEEKALVDIKNNKWYHKIWNRVLEIFKIFKRK